MQEQVQHEAALWQCDDCEAWWCSQLVREATDFLLLLPGSVLEQLGWDNFRGWRVGGTPHVATCPNCHALSQNPRHGNTSIRPSLAVSVAAFSGPTLPQIRL